MNFNQSKYRITYEAFSKFSSKLSKAETLEEVSKLTLTNLKYFFNYHSISIKSITRNHQLCFSFSINKADFYYEKLGLNIFEKRLFERKVPIYEELRENDISTLTNFDLPVLEEAKIYASYFDYGSTKACVSIISDENRKFGMDDVEILRLLTDAFVSKTRQIRLKSELEEKNEEFKNAIQEIDVKNKQIESIVDTQKAIIKIRTKNILDKNKQLVSILQSISHNLQEPLSRILGLLDLSEGVSKDEFIVDILPYLKESATDLDIIFKDLVKKNAEDIKLLSKENDE
ncbi:phytochrome family protein [Mesonia aquimarina]|uniref:hypothetical protein n=1 Tax=Mesonia aquimarina TaxID=1504967 RepID=UPI000EF5AA57|nr:hypothetical protein [Mesonia aquimarina]